MTPRTASLALPLLFALATVGCALNPTPRARSEYDAGTALPAVDAGDSFPDAAVSLTDRSEPIYVNAVTGSDAFDGSSPTVLDGSVGPLRTLDAALARVAERRAGGDDGELRVQLSGHTYELARPVEINAQHSGLGPDSETVIAGVVGRTRLDGSREAVFRPLESDDAYADRFRVPSENVFVFDLSASPAPLDAVTNVAFLFSERMPLNRARLPYNEELVVTRVHPDVLGTAWSDSTNLFYVDIASYFDENGDGLLQPHERPPLEGAELVLFQRWAQSRMQIDAAEGIGAAGLVHLRQGTLYRPSSEVAGRNASYYHLENLPEGVHRFGDWVYDPVQRRLYVHAESLEATEGIRVPVTDQLVRLGTEREDDPAVEHVRFEGLELTHNGLDQTTWYRTVAGALVPIGGFNKSSLLEGALLIQNAVHISVDGCRFHEVGNHGVSVLGRGNGDISVVDSEFEAVGASAVNVFEWRVDFQQAPGYLDEGPTRAPLDEMPADITVDRNRVHRVGRYYRDAPALGFRMAHRVSVRDNLIEGVHSNAIAILNLYDSAYARFGDNLISGNEVYNEGSYNTPALLNDKGMIHILGRHQGTVIELNRLSGFWAALDGHAVGIYVDENADGVTVRSNRIERLGGYGLMAHNSRGQVDFIENDVVARWGAYVGYDNAPVCRESDPRLRFLGNRFHLTRPYGDTGRFALMVRPSEPTDCAEDVRRYEIGHSPSGTESVIYRHGAPDCTAVEEITVAGVPLHRIADRIEYTCADWTETAP